MSLRVGAEAGALPDGLLVGHWTDPVGLTGCTVVLAPQGARAGGEVRGGGPGTRESDLLQPTSGDRLVQGLLLTGGSAFGLAAADGVVGWLAERGLGHETGLGIRVPLVPGAVVFDLGRGSADARPDAAAGRAACDAAVGGVPARGAFGAGTGCAAGKLQRDPALWAPTGIGWATDEVGGAFVGALAVVNPLGDVVGGDGRVLAGARRADGTPVASTQLLREGAPSPVGREATTLVCVLTDAKLDRTAAWLVARAASGGVARAVQPTATPSDGDFACCLATGAIDVDPAVLAAVAQDVVAAAVRDGAVP